MTQQAPEEEKSSPKRETISKPSQKKHSPEIKPTQRLGWLDGGRGLLIGLSLGILATLGGTRFLIPQQTKTESQDQSAPSTTAKAPAQSITVATANLSQVKRSIEASGNIAAFELISISSQVTGLQIEEILVEEGDFVQAGEVMARLDDSKLQAQLKQAEASIAQTKARLRELRAGARPQVIAQARANVRSARAGVEQAKASLERSQQQLKRNRMLAAEGAIAQDRLDEIVSQWKSNRSSLQQAKAQFREAKQRLAELKAGARPEAIAQAQARLANAKAQKEEIQERLQDTKIVAPVSGKVAQKQASIGELSSASDTLFTIIQNGRLEAHLKVPETQLPKIRPGQTVQIASTADRSLEMSGTVRTIRPMVEQDSRQATVKVDLPKSELLRPGMFVQASIITAASQRLTVPLEGVLPQSNRNSIVYVLQEDNTVKAQSVTLGNILSNQRVVIKSGLSQGDRVVVKGAPYLENGDRVKVVGS
ncbi:MAG: efflux RND transporter periplasmic adaptor subunit [Halothece sp.]